MMIKTLILVLDASLYGLNILLKHLDMLSYMRIGSYKLSWLAKHNKLKLVWVGKPHYQIAYNYLKA